MSNHFHILIDTSIQLEKLKRGEAPDDDNYTSLAKIMQYIKGGSAFLINKEIGRSGTFWRGESYDHLVRDGDESFRIHRYILNNPVKAGIVGEWQAHGFTYSCVPELHRKGA